MAKTTDTENIPQGEEGASSQSGGRRAGVGPQEPASSASAGAPSASASSGTTVEQPTGDRHTIAARKSQYLTRRTPHTRHADDGFAALVL